MTRDARAGEKEERKKCNRSRRRRRRRRSHRATFPAGRKKGQRTGIIRDVAALLHANGQPAGRPASRPLRTRTICCVSCPAFKFPRPASKICGGCEQKALSEELETSESIARPWPVGTRGRPTSSLVWPHISQAKDVLAAGG